MARLARLGMFLVCSLVACRASVPARSDDRSATAGPPPALIPVDAAGLSQLTEDGEARLVMINIWAMWCEPCKEEIPDLVRLGEEFAPRGLALKFVTVDGPDKEAAASAFLQEHGAAPPYYVRTGKDMPFIEALHPDWNGTLPATCLFEPNGTRVGFWDRPIDYDTLHEILEMFEWSDS